MMEFLIQAEEKVKYACSCGSLKSIAKIYFCRHCMKIRCGYCVSHEVDLHYCGNCLENLPSTEARLKKNRCGYCFNCPSCQNILNVRAVSSTIPNPDDPAKTVSKKFYYLACGFCRWTSREVGLPDQSTCKHLCCCGVRGSNGETCVASGGWPERECPNAKRVSELVDHYQEVAQLEKMEEDEKKKKYQARPSYFHFAEKFGLGVAAARKRLATPPREQRQPQARVQQAQASEDVPQLPDDIFTSHVDLTAVTTLQQRFAAPEVQPVEVSDLYPVHKPMLAKRSLRCRECEHNVSKPEFNPSSTKFKIQLSAFYHVPDIRFMTCEPIYLGRESELIVTMCNPTQHPMTVQLVPCEQKPVVEQPSKDTGSSEEVEEALTSALTHQLVLSEGLRSEQFLVNGTIGLPEQEIQLMQRDDAAEFDDTSKAPTFTDDPKLVAWRKGNKVALRLRVKPEEGASGKLGVSFFMKYTHVNTMATLEKKEPQKLQLQCQVFLNAGNIFGTAQ
ncbi:hypothetical protein B566_EDAN010441 [Ephemera danica]|nr:hypothetical protein B566_EDAN010441 [Ephemera danica]